MKLRIVIDDQYSQDLLRDDVFRSLFEYVYNGEGMISEIWITNKIINNDEVTFRTQTLELIKQHYCRIFDIKADYFDYAFDLSDKGYMVVSLIRTGPKHRLPPVVVIKEFSAD